MEFDILTLFPETFEGFLTASIIGRAQEKGIIKVERFNIRDFSKDKHRKVDDEPYGGGAGMVMTCQPLFDAIEFVKSRKKDKSVVIFFTPSKHIWHQTMAEKAAKGELGGYTGIQRYILLCGHYEGIDQRVRDALVDAEISIGNYVLTGGEIPAMVFIDSITRLLPGAITSPESHQEESFSSSLGREVLEYPHYTRPAEFRGMKVPEVLLSGHHENILKWRREQCKKLSEGESENFF